MTRIVDRAKGPRQATSGAHGAATRTTDVALAIVLARLRSCIADKGYTLEGLAVAMGKPESYRAYISNVLTGEKPLSYAFFVSLPADVQAEFHERSLKDFGGLVVPDAVRQFMAGLFGAAQPLAALPEKAGAPLRAELDAEPARRRA